MPFSNSFFDSLDWSSWIYGLFAGGIGGGATAVYCGFFAGAIDQHFALGSSNSFKLMGLMFAMSFLKDAALYLKQNPLPHVKVVTTTVQTTEKIQPASTVVTTVEETHAEEIKTALKP